MPGGLPGPACCIPYILQPLTHLAAHTAAPAHTLGAHTASLYTPSMQTLQARYTAAPINCSPYTLQPRYTSCTPYPLQTPLPSPPALPGLAVPALRHPQGGGISAPQVLSSGGSPWGGANNGDIGGNGGGEAYWGVARVGGLCRGGQGCPAEPPHHQRDCLGARVPRWVTGGEDGTLTTSLGLGRRLLLQCVPQGAKAGEHGVLLSSTSARGLGGTGCSPCSHRGRDSVCLLKETNS